MDTIIKELERMLRVQLKRNFDKFRENCEGPGIVVVNPDLFMVLESELSAKPTLMVLGERVPVVFDPEVSVSSPLWKNRYHENPENLIVLQQSIQACEQKMDELGPQAAGNKSAKKDLRVLQKKLEGFLKEFESGLSSAKEMQETLSVPPELSKFVEVYTTVL